MNYLNKKGKSKQIFADGTTILFRNKFKYTTETKKSNILWVICQNTSPHNFCLFMCHYRKMYYYCTLTAAWTLIFLTISADVSLFLIISPHESCDIVHLPIWSHFSFSCTPTRLFLYFAITPPLWICFFSHACMSHAPYLLFQRFFLLAKF